MNPQKVVFAFFIMLALTLNFGFVVGDIDDPAHHHALELFAAIVVSLIATILKFGDHTELGSVVLAASLVADLQLIAAAVVWAMVEYVLETGMDSTATASIVSLAGGALLANLISVVLLIIETVLSRR